jgi:hypothetical protein
MSIFKETFPKFITEQLKIREDIISSGAGKTNEGFKFNENRENDFFTYTLNKQCTLRMSSGVNVIDQALLKDLTNSDQQSLPGKTLAEQFILQSGVKTPNLQGGIGDGGAYGDPDLAANSRGDGLGIVPMPGIIDATISTKSAYGSLREAKVKFVAHNKKQLQILEMLYMRPGYTLMLEWGWTPYFIKGDNNDTPSKQNFIKWVSNFFNANTKTQDLENQIFENKTESGGNYDALIGYCKNFSYSLRPDGGFNCETEIISKGEIIESLKEEELRAPYTNTKTDIQYTFTPKTLLVLDKIRQFSIFTADVNNTTWQNPFTFTKGHYGNAFEFASTEEERRSLYEEQLLNDLELSIPEGSTPKKELLKFIIAKDEEDSGVDFKTEDEINYELKEGPQAIRSETTYVRWDALCLLINKYVIPKNKKNKPLFSLQTNQLSNDRSTISTLRYVDVVPQTIKDNAKELVVSTWKKKDNNGQDIIEDTIQQINWNNADISANPQMCIFPHTLFNQPEDILYRYNKNSSKINHKNKIHNKLYEPLAQQLINTSTNPEEVKQEFGDKDINYSIGGIFIGVEYLISTFQSMYYDEIGAIKKDYSLFRFIKRIWEDINNACGNSHEFDIHVENNASGKILRIVDFIVDAEEIELDKVHELKIQSLDSTVRDIVYNTNLPSSLSTTIAVAAQAPDSIDSLDKVSFAAISSNIIDRFATPIISDNTPTEDQIAKWTAEWDKNVNEIRHIAHSKDEDWGVLNDFLYETDEKANQYSDEDSFADFSKYRGAAGQVKKAINYLYQVYAHEDIGKGIYRGQPIPNPTPRLSAVIPLNFNVKMDGIGGIIIGNVFKLPKNRLPFSYREEDIYFIVMGEEQSINSKQDWTTSIKGQLILLSKEIKRNNEVKENWKNINSKLLTKKTEKEVREEKNNNNGWKKYVKDTPWSAAFISSMVKQAGDSTFPFDASHSNYATRIKKGESNNWKAIDPLTTPLRHGDIIVYNTDSSAYQYSDFAENAPFSSHGDIVVGINANSESVILIGGNLSNSVIKKTLSTTAGDDLKWKDGDNANTAAYIPIGSGTRTVAVYPEITRRDVIVDGEKKFFNVETFLKLPPSARLKENYYVILRCSDNNIINGMIKNASDALSEFQNGAIKEDDNKVAETIYGYFINCGINPPKPNSLKTI